MSATLKRTEEIVKVFSAQVPSLHNPIQFTYTFSAVNEEVHELRLRVVLTGYDYRIRSNSVTLKDEQLELPNSALKHLAQHLVLRLLRVKA